MYCTASGCVHERGWLRSAVDAAAQDFLYRSLLSHSSKYGFILFVSDVYIRFSIPSARCLVLRERLAYLRFTSCATLQLKLLLCWGLDTISLLRADGSFDQSAEGWGTPSQSCYSKIWSKVRITSCLASFLPEIFSIIYGASELFTTQLQEALPIAFPRDKRGIRLKNARSWYWLESWNDSPLKRLRYQIAVKKSRYLRVRV